MYKLSKEQIINAMLDASVWTDHMTSKEYAFMTGNNARESVINRLFDLNFEDNDDKDNHKWSQHGERICGHHIIFRYETGRSDLPETEEQYIRQQLCENYTEGELCYLDSDEDGENEKEVRGWWQIKE